MPLLADILGTSLLGTVKELISSFVADPTVKTQMLAAADANATQIQIKQIELEGKLQDELAAEVNAASQNIRADAASGDNFTKRARPSVIYWGMAIFGINYGILPLLQRTPLPFPDALFWLWGSCVLGYTGARTWEKLGILGNGKQ